MEPGLGTVAALRIAVLAPLAWRVPPAHYGPWEQFASLLTEGLVARGHDVTLFASGTSSTNAKLVAVVPHGWSEAAGIDAKVAECTHVAAAFERADEFVIGFDEPFGFSVAEAMACGTPVVAYDRGSMRELIDDGRTGFVVDSADAAVAAVAHADELDRTDIRGLAVARFGRDRMVDEYVEVYRAVLSERQ